MVGSYHKCIIGALFCFCPKYVVNCFINTHILLAELVGPYKNKNMLFIKYGNIVNRKTLEIKNLFDIDIYPTPEL